MAGYYTGGSLLVVDLRSSQLRTIRTPCAPHRLRDRLGSEHRDPRRGVDPRQDLTFRPIAPCEPDASPLTVVPPTNAACYREPLEHGPLVPPWRMPLPSRATAALVKCRPPRSDLRYVGGHRGAMVDCFI